MQLLELRMSLTGGIAAGLQMDDWLVITLEGGVLTTGGLQYTGEVEAGGGDLAFLGVGGLDFPS